MRRGSFVSISWCGVGNRGRNRRNVTLALVGNPDISNILHILTTPKPSLGPRLPENTASWERGLPARVRWRRHPGGRAGRMPALPGRSRPKLSFVRNQVAYRERLDGRAHDAGGARAPRRASTDTQRRRLAGRRGPDRPPAPVSFRIGISRRRAPRGRERSHRAIRPDRPDRPNRLGAVRRFPGSGRANPRTRPARRGRTSSSAGSWPAR